MKKYIYFIGLAITTSVIANPELDCPKNMNNGTYIGRLTTIIDKADWPHSTYIFTPENNKESEGCVQIDSSNTQRNRIVFDAFMLSKIVKIKVTDNHFIDGIGY